MFRFNRFAFAHSKKLIVITGSANPHGIGSNLVSRFLEDENNLVATCDISPFDRKQIASWMAKAATASSSSLSSKEEETDTNEGVNRLFINSNCDVSNEESVKQFYHQLNDYFSKEIIRRDISSFCLINNAAIANPYMPSSSPVDDKESEDFENEILSTPNGEEHPPPPASMLNTKALENFLKVNVLGPALMMKYFCRKIIPIGKKLDDVSIINISSTRAVMSEPQSEGYAASKAALEGLTHAAAITNSPTNAQRMRVNAVRLGWINCAPPPQSKKDKSDQKQQNGDFDYLDQLPFDNTKEKIESLQPKQRDHDFHPCGRVGTADDVFGVCEFLCDAKKSGFMTGQILTVDGGVSRKMIYPEDE